MTEVQEGVGKTEIGLIICVALCALLAISTIFLYLHNNNLQNQVVTLQPYMHELSILESTYHNYVATHEHTNSEYEQAIFEFYYVEPEQKFGVDELEAELSYIEFKKPYIEGVFDCSEMSAYLERHLENNGWHTIIVAGNNPSGNGSHSWILVETNRDAYMPIEATTIQIVYWDNSDFDNYFDYYKSFETIQEALEYSHEEFDWWSS